MILSKTLLILIDIFFTLLLIILLVTSGLIFYSIFVSELPFHVLSNDGLDSLSSFKGIKFLFSGVVQLLFIATLFFLRKGIHGMVKEHFFNLHVAKNLNLAGVILTVVSIGTVIFDFAHDLSDGLLTIGMETDLLKSEIFMIIVGLFLMLMARVLKEGVVMKSENELTI